MDTADIAAEEEEVEDMVGMIDIVAGIVGMAVVEGIADIDSGRSVDSVVEHIEEDIVADTVDIVADTGLWEDNILVEEVEREEVGH